MKVLIAGLGVMGCCSAMHLASRGATVIGFDRFERGHSLGASSGKSRIVRQAYFENAAYVPLLLRAYELWSDLERRSGERIMHLVGLLLAGRNDSAIL